MLVVGKFWKIWFDGVALLVAGLLFFCLDLMFMFFDLVVVIYGFFVCFFCVCLARKFMSLKAKVGFARDMGLGFGWDLGLGFGSLLEIDYREEQERIK